MKLDLKYVNRYRDSSNTKSEIFNQTTDYFERIYLTDKNENNSRIVIFGYFIYDSSSLYSEILTACIIYLRLPVTFFIN